ncbi:hypothetical protein WAK64_08420 [Bacillus spongiae]|uniref:Cyclic lactone autoinducer peptide n=1 Tax=Bacillus spongiae TaxID=2683610 RepID=A0ABU8HCL5_9BACI
MNKAKKFILVSVLTLGVLAGFAQFDPSSASACARATDYCIEP